MRPPFKLRKFEISDLGRVLEIEKSSFSAVDAYPRKRFENFYQQHSNDFFVVETPDKVIGYIIAYPKKEFVDFNSIAVDKEYRNLGVGSMLVDSMINRFRKNGFKKASLEVRTINRAAISFYEKFGFKIVETIKAYYRDEQDAYRMEKIL